MCLLRTCGFSEVSLTERFDCFRGTSKETLARKFEVEGVNVFARKLGVSVSKAETGSEDNEDVD